MFISILGGDGRMMNISC